MKMRFIGETDENFTNNCIYEIIEISYKENYWFSTYIINDSNKVRHIPYSSINTFLHNWEVVDE